MKKSLTVGELKKALKSVPDDLPVYAALGLEHIVPGGGDYEWYVTTAEESPESSISNRHFSIELGESFGW